jgi:excisionase family DNA binding protein
MPRERSHINRSDTGRPLDIDKGRRLMTAVEVADLLAVPTTRVWSMSRRGEIPTVRLGPREVRYRPQDIEAWIARRTTSRPRGTQS